MRVRFLFVFILGSLTASWAAAPSPEAILHRSRKALQSIHQVYFEVTAKSRRTEGEEVSAQLWAYRTEADTATPWDNVLILSEWADWRFDGTTYQSVLHEDKEVRTSANDPRLTGFRTTRMGPGYLFMLKEFFDPEKMVERWTSTEGLQVFNEGDSWVVGMPISSVGYQKLYFRKSDLLPWKKQEGYLQGIAYNEVTITYMDVEASNTPQAIADFPGWPSSYTQVNANEPPRPSSTLLVGDAAPTWSLPSLQERVWNSGEMQDSNLLLIIWQEDCSNCQRALNEVKTWKEDFAKKNLITLSMIQDPSPELKGQLLEQGGDAFTHLQLTTETLDDFGPEEYPFFCVVDPEGVVQYMNIGYNQAYVRQWLMDNLE